MRFRRHVPKKADRFWWLKRPRRARQAPSEPDSGADAPRKTRGRRRRVTVQLAALGFAAAFVAGYVLAVLLLFPAPIFAATRSVPLLVGMTRPDGEAKLEEENLLVGDIEGISHPTAPRGQIVWQDPPAGVGVPEGTLIRFSVSNGPQRVPVPDLLGYDAEIAGQLLVAAGLQIGRVSRTQAPVPEGVVVSTRPSTGSTLLPGGEVTLVVSVGAPTITVPDLSGLTPEEAEIILQQVGLTLGTTLRKPSSEAPPGTVVEQTPAPGTLSAPGTAVNVFLARPPR